MVSPSDDLDLTQAQAYALQASDLAELLDSVDVSLTASLAQLQSAADLTSLHRCLHDLKGYLGLVAKVALCELAQQADLHARQGHDSATQDVLGALVPRLERLHKALQAYRAGIIGH